MKQPWPIRWSLYLLLVATAAPLCAAIAMALLREAEEGQRNAERLVVSLASVAAANARARLAETETLAASLAQRISTADPARCGRTLAELLPLLPRYTNISVVAPDGAFVCSAVPVEGERLPLHGAIRGALEGRFALSAPMVGVLPRRLVVSTGYPVRDANGKVVGALTMPIDLAAFQPASDPKSLPAGARVRIIDGAGVLLASSTPGDPELGSDLRGAAVTEHVLRGAGNSVTARGSDGVLRIYGYVPVGSNDWHAYAGVPADEILAPTRARTLSNAAITAALLAFALLAATLVGRRITRSAGSLQLAMDEAATGLVVYAPETGPRELRTLAANYNRMLARMTSARAALNWSEARLRLAVRASRIGLWDWDIRAGRVYFSPEWKRQLGYDVDDLGDVPAEWSDRLHPDDRARVLGEVEMLIANGGSQYEAEFRMRRKDGSYRWIYSSAEVMRDDRGGALRMLGTHIDVTQRKVLEQSMRNTVGELRVLSMRLMQAEEAERRRIGSDLHDRTGANFAALQIDLRLLSDKLHDGDIDTAADLADAARETLSECSAELRGLMTELRPAALDDFGLYPALLSYARHVTSRFGLALKASGGPVEPRPAAVIETALFRIAQEAMTNAAKHARAKTLEVALATRDGRLVLSVADDGVGFDPAVAARDDSLGMRTMRERADAIAATLTVRSTPGQGTRVEVDAPMA